MNIWISLFYGILLIIYLYALFQNKNFAFGVNESMKSVGNYAVTVILIIFAAEGSFFDTEFDLLNYVLIIALIIASLLDMLLSDKAKMEG